MTDIFKPKPIEWYVVQNEKSDVEVHVFDSSGDCIYYKEIFIDTPLFLKNTGVIPLIFKIIERENDSLNIVSNAIYKHRKELLEDILCKNKIKDVLMMKELHEDDDRFKIRVNGKTYCVNLSECKFKEEK